MKSSNEHLNAGLNGAQDPTRSSLPEGTGPAAQAKAPVGAPEALRLALDQLHEVLKSCGTEQLSNLTEGETSGYPQVATVLEKLSKCALDWQEYNDRRRGDGSSQNQQAAGYSKQTEQQIAVELEGTPAPKPG